MTDIEDVVEKCNNCQTLRRKLQKEPLINHDIPNNAFEKIACDVMEFGNKSYLVIVDYYSKWIEFKHMKTKTARDITNVWIEFFANFGVPLIVVADNMPFDSFECREFARRFEFTIVTSSPLYPKSNGWLKGVSKYVRTY